jgi:S1-C subfamily serine protease
MRGEVVGINTFIETRTGGNLGIGFAVPADIIMNVYHRSSSSARSAAGTGDLHEHLPHHRGDAEIFRPEGKERDRHRPGGEELPARDAGIQPEDMITAINGKEVTDADAARDGGQYPAGFHGQVKVVRKGDGVRREQRRPSFAARSMAARWTW